MTRRDRVFSLPEAELPDGFVPPSAGVRTDAVPPALHRYPPYAEITRLGRWTYGIHIVDGLVSTSHPWSLGRHRAERKARRMLAWYTREGRTAEERWTIR